MKIPDQIIDNDAFSLFDPNEDAIDFYESIEGMRVTMPTQNCTSEKWKFICNSKNGGDKIVTQYGTPIR